MQVTIININIFTGLVKLVVTAKYCMDICHFSKTFSEIIKTYLVPNLRMHGFIMLHQHCASSTFLI